MDVQNHHLPKTQVIAVMVPFPAQSHLNQLLQLSCLISSSYQIPVHFVASSTHIHQTKLRFNSSSNSSSLSKIRFYSLPSPQFPSPSPNPYGPTKFPSHLQPSFEASKQLRKPTFELLLKLSATTTRIIVIHDVLTSYVVQDSASLPNAECYGFRPISAFASFFDRMHPKANPNPSEVDDPPPKGLPSIGGCYTSEIESFLSFQLDHFKRFSAGSILNTCRAIEGKYIDLLIKKDAGKNNKQLWAIGPLSSRIVWESSRDQTRQHKCLDWLQKQGPKSVLYVSFGTTTSMTNEQIKELAMGLEQSQQKFIWVCREADKGDIFAGDGERAAVLPEGYEERVKEFGLVVRDWAPQREILGHPSTGGFMSHCGWNSCLESITNGVPMAAWPMHSDQPKNAFFVTDILKVGLVVKEWARREELVSSTDISNAIKRLMASKEGDELRKRSAELGGAAVQSVKEGGDSCRDLDSFIAHITR